MAESGIALVIGTGVSGSTVENDHAVAAAGAQAVSSAVKLDHC
jgi:uncharacterized protein GlcG (DUF336 family)